MKKTLKIVVLAKQVPDTRNVGKDAMKADGTVNRAALPAIFNPEDLNALEQALVLKDMFPGSRVDILTMGPGRAAEIIREGMFRGADGGVLLTDRKFAGSDTLATSYALSRAAAKMNPDIIIAGRQAIDGDTAQVGDELVIRRRLEHGVETVACRMPLVMTVNGSAAECRPRHAKLVMKYKYAITPSECQQDEVGCYANLRAQRPYLNITEWNVADVDADDRQLGLSGSPTKVKKIENVVFAAKEAKKLTASDQDIDSLMQELIASHTLG